jgi:hypothetical protein
MNRGNVDMHGIDECPTIYSFRCLRHREKMMQKMSQFMANLNQNELSGMTNNVEASYDMTVWYGTQC